MTVDEIFSTLQGVGIKLWLVEGRLRFRAPATAMTDQVRDAILANRSAIVSRLQREQRLFCTSSKGCGGCDRHDWVDAPSQEGWIRTTCRRCGTFIGYRPASFGPAGRRT